MMPASRERVEIKLAVYRIVRDVTKVGCRRRMCGDTISCFADKSRSVSV